MRRGHTPEDAMTNRPRARARLALVATLCLSLLALGSPALAIDGTSTGEDPQIAEPSPILMAYDQLDVEDRQGYTSEYIFGMSKAVTRSTLVPALKPVALLFTVPLDLVFLPFAALGGFFR